MAQVIAFVDDIFFQAKIMETAKQVGVEIRCCTTPDALLDEITKHPPNLVIVDLNARSKPLDAIERVRQTSPSLRVLAFLSHVQVDLAESARLAGCQDVMPRSKFTQSLATILVQAKSQCG